VSFGIGRHTLRSSGGDHRQEILVAVRRSWREIATSILVSTGVYMVD